MMPFAFRHGALVLALIGGVALAIASDFASDETLDVTLADEPSDVAPLSPANEMTGSVGHGGGLDQELPLSDEQRGWVFLGVINLPDVPEADVTPPSWAEALPKTVELQDLPAMVTRKIPLLRDHKFVKLDDRILVVRPDDGMIVAEIPRYRLLP
jgi:hypothetical protein